MIDLDVDELQLYFGDDYIINEHIRITQPSIDDVVKYGEGKYFSMVHIMTAIPSDVKSMLWDQMGLDWTEVEDFELFMMFAQTLTVDKTSILFGDLDFSKFRPFKNPQNDDIVLANIETHVIIDKMIYMRIMNYLRKLHNIKPKVEKAANKMTKKILIDEDRQKYLMQKDKPFQSYLLPLISAVKVKQGYTKTYIKDMGLYEFFDDLARIQVVDHADHLLMGSYMGMADLSKVPKQDFNWMRPLDEK